MGAATAVEPNHGDRQLSTADLAAALAVDPIEWVIEVPAIKGWLDTIGPQLPTSLHVELDALRQRLGVG